MPNGAAQQAAIRAALERGRVAPGDIQYVEAHGPGTPVGDPIEAEALGQALGRDRHAPCVVGSVKTNLGHLEAAAGMAGLVKLALALYHRQIPPNLHFQEPNPKIDWERLKLRVPVALEPWPENRAGAPRLAGINSFGFGGANAHAILAEAPHASAAGPRLPDAPELLTLSARSDAALKALAERYRGRLESGSDALGDFCFSAGARRTHHPCRLAVAASNSEGMREKLLAFLNGESRAGLCVGRATDGSNNAAPVFVFSGMGQQWAGMGRELWDESEVFRTVVEACARELRSHASWSLAEALREPTAPIDRTEVAQVAIFALQMGLAAHWWSWGVEPVAVVGHSVGEVAAACMAGALTLGDAVRVVFHRSRLQATTAGQGAMLAVGLTDEEARARIAGLQTTVSIAAINSPRSVTLAGDTAALQRLADELGRDQVFHRFLKVEVPYHSPLMEPLMAPLEGALFGLEPRAAKLALFSTVTGRRIEGTELGPQYWAENMRKPVRFADAARALAAEHTRFVEIAAHPVLGFSLKENGPTAVFASLRRDQPARESLLASLGEQYVAGYPVSWRQIHPAARRYVPLPLYPWQRTRHWLEAPETRQHRLDERCHPLLGRRLSAPEPAWEAEIDAERFPYLRDHRIHGEAVYPSTAYGEMALAASRQLHGEGVHRLSEVAYDKALTLSGCGRLRLTLAADRLSFTIHSLQGEDWIPHARGKAAREPHPAEPPRWDLEAIRGRCREERSGPGLLPVADRDRIRLRPDVSGGATGLAG